METGQTTEGLRQRVTHAAENVRDTLSRAERETISHIPHSATEVWSSIPNFFQILMFIEGLFFAITGLLMTVSPLTYLALLKGVSTFMNWAGPTPAVSSNSLLLHVQLAGALMQALSLLTLLGFYRRDPNFSRCYSAARVLMGIAMLYAVFAGHGTAATWGVVTSMFGKSGSAVGASKASTTFNILWLPAIESMLHITNLMSVPGLKSLMRRLPATMEAAATSIGGSSSGSGAGGRTTTTSTTTTHHHQRAE
jgi:hypothetical protein